MSAAFKVPPRLFTGPSPPDTNFGCCPEPAELEVELTVTHFPFVLGRHPQCDSALTSRQISRRHCQFFLLDGAIWLEDLNSYNGTYLNEHKIQQAEPVHDGDILTLHPYRYRCQLETSTAEELKLRLIPQGLEETH